MAGIERLGPGIWAREVVLEEYAVRGVLLLGEDRAIVWDTLSRPADMRPFLPLIADRPLVVVYSHADWDHVWGTAGLPYAQARIIAHERARARFASDVPAALAEKQAAEPGAWDDVLLVPPSEVIPPPGVIDLGGLSLELHPLPGHTPDCLVGFAPERGLLLAGDTVETPFPVVPPDSPLAAWIAELERWAADDRVRRVVPAHGRMGGREILLENIACLQGLLRGQPVEPQGELAPFYHRTHLANTRWSGRRS
jgi:glyoxylase-like metal-dependent hydrolase (beta-lactamase superfamily II)